MLKSLKTLFKRPLYRYIVLTSDKRSKVWKDYYEVVGLTLFPKAPLYIRKVLLWDSALSAYQVRKVVLTPIGITNYLIYVEIKEDN